MEKKDSPEAAARSSLEAIADQVSSGNWKEVLKLTESDAENPLYQILRQKARYELKEWKSILEANPNQDLRFKAYDEYIRILAQYENEELEKVILAKAPSDLPPAYQEYIHLIQARSLLKLKKLPEAKRAFRDFLETYPKTSYKSEVLMELANVEWTLDNKFEALHLYERIYIHFPLGDSENLAPQRLKEMGRLEAIEPAVHLRRIRSLQQLALFSRALRELQSLERMTEDKDRERIRLAIASLEFARKAYSKAESLSRSGLKRAGTENIALADEWKSLLAFSLVRQGRFDQAREIYDELLQTDIPQSEKEQILLRLGLMAVDESDFANAEKYFSRLRTEFKGGRYEESSHWFESWSILQQYFNLEDEKPSPELVEKLKTAIKLLSRLPELPQGKALAGQALYWKSRAQRATGDTKAADRSLKTLDTKWSASFYSLLADLKDFDFLFYQENLAAPELIVRENPNFIVADPAFQQLSWKRLEAFVSVRLHHWAQQELETFMRVSGQKNRGLRKAVAHRLELLGDWSDLVRFAQRNFELDLSEIKPEEELSRFHYPQAYGEEVLKAANEFQVSPFLIWGVMREESRFQADAVSPAGAVGLLQLMPNLGSQIAVRLREGRVNRQELTDPSLNIRYAAFHLKELIEQIQSWEVKPEFVFPLVVASYNAGVGPVRRWLRESKDAPLDVFVESISYSETRSYVKRVMQSANIYWRLYGEKNDRLAKKKGDSDL